MNKLEIVREICRSYNQLDSTIIEAYSSHHIIYESQWVIGSINGVKEVVDYLAKKFETIKTFQSKIYAELAYYGNEPCIVLAQGSSENKIATLLIEITDDKISRLDICQVPHWDETNRTNEYPH